MNLAILSVQHRHHGLVEVERIVDSAEEIAARLRAVPGVESVLPLTTCNRVEFVVDAPGRSTAELVESLAPELDLPPSWDRYDDDEAIGHLFRVCAGLDSMVVGEREIAGQVRRALAEAQDAELASPHLSLAVEEALRSSRRVARETTLAEAGRSVVSVALDLANVADWPSARVLLVGTGAFAGASVAALRTRGAHAIRVHSASGRGDDFATSHHLAVAGDLAQALREVDLVVACRGTGVPAITAADVDPGAQLTILDLALHSDVAPSVAALPGVDVISLATLQEALSARWDPDTSKAEQIVAEGCEALRTKLQTRVLDPAVVSLREAVLELVDDEVARLPQGRPLDHADAAHALRRLATRLLHVPSSRAKLAAASGRTTEYLSAMAELYGIGGSDEALDEGSCPATGLTVEDLDTGSEQSPGEPRQGKVG
ncbi:glutamyl-tRNA reductase [Tessaracoccus sp. OS52]|uniref:glutamyl-tRNA reductase n=1 Tax=Tessaracoccus sp. OS52 TaxID=2886691 RepID=UPI001D12DCFB|nr:glutamyl-tRNA reductase [Tessaracoccus sp. OS52]